MVFLSLVLPTILLGTSPPPPSQFVPGEILVRFVPGTDGSAAVTRASQVNPPDLEVLAPVISRLQAKTGIPLRAVQVMGGDWFRLSVDGDRLTDQLVKRLRTRDNVAEVRVSPEQPEAAMGVSVPKKLAIRFSPGSAESEAVTQKHADATDVRFAQLMRELGRDLDLPVKGEVSEQGEALVQIDLRALTPILADRLKALSDIESAQPNYILTIK